MSAKQPSVLQLLERWRFAILLGCLLGLFLIQPMLPLRPDGGEHLGTDTALAFVLLASFWSLGHRASLRLTGLALVAAALTAAWIAHVAPGRNSVLAALSLALLALAFTVGVVLWRLIREKVVRTETILGGICVYFLLGCVWAIIYSLLEQLQPGSLQSGTGVLFRSEQMGTLLVPDLLYYSVFVLTTIGPQEVHPISSAARAWTGVEAMAGQLFLVIFISRMVSLHGLSSPSDDR
ncbi:MAG TPA: ion channel [Myxococcota bacterium]|jgi:hypothetical protein